VLEVSFELCALDLELSFMTLASSHAACKTTPIRWRIVTLLMALCFISHLNRISMSVAGDQRIMKQFAIAPDQMGLVYSAFLLVYTVCMIPGGFFIDRFGPRVALMVMGFGSAVFCALTGSVGLGIVTASQVWLSLIIVRGLMGFFTTPLHPGCARAVADWTPLPKRSLVNGLVTGAALLGIACTYKIFGTLIDWFDWPKAFLITGTSTALLTMLWAFWSRADSGTASVARSLQCSETSESGADTAARLPWIRLLKNRSLLLLTLSYGAIGYFQYLFFYWMHYYFDEVLHLGKSASQFYAGIPPLAMAFGMPLGGWLSDQLQRSLGLRWGRAIVPIVGMIVGALLLGLGIGAKQPAWIIVWFSLALGVVGACEGSFWSTAVELGGPLGGTAAAIVNTGGNGGGLLAPYLTPLVSTKFGWPLGLSLGGIISFLGALCWFWIDPAEQKKEST
jgi:MFS family permease